MLTFRVKKFIYDVSIYIYNNNNNNNNKKSSYYYYDVCVIFKSVLKSVFNLNLETFCCSLYIISLHTYIYHVLFYNIFYMDHLQFSTNMTTFNATRILLYYFFITYSFKFIMKCLHFLYIQILHKFLLLFTYKTLNFLLKP